MNEALSPSLTEFDALAIALIILSALMGLARGFIRELATLAAFIAAVAGAYYARATFGETASAWTPGSLPAWSGQVVLALVVFVIVYAIGAWIGTNLAKTVRGLEGVGAVDRAAGLAFGGARAVVVLVFTAFVAIQAVPEGRMPEWIDRSRLFPYFSAWASGFDNAAAQISEESDTPIDDNGA